MIEVTVKEYLAQALALPVYLVTPEQIPDEYIILERTAGSEENFIERVTLAIQSISSQSLYRAARINESVKAAMRGIAAVTCISRSKRNTDYNYTDTTTKQYRYQAVYDITFKEV